MRTPWILQGPVRMEQTLSPMTQLVIQGPHLPMDLRSQHCPAPLRMVAPTEQASAATDSSAKETAGVLLPEVRNAGGTMSIWTPNHRAFAHLAPRKSSMRLKNLASR